MIADISNLAWGIIGFLIVIGMGIIGRVRPKEKVVGFPRNNVAGLFIVLGIALLVVQGGFAEGVGITALALGGATGPVDTGDGTVVNVNLQADILGCDLGTKTTVTLSAEDVYTGNAVGGTHRYRVNGAPALTVSDAGTFTASPGDTIEILWMNNSVTSYFGVIETVQVPCTGAKTFSQRLYNNGTFSIQVFNEEGDVITGGTTETLGAGDVVTLDANIKIAFEVGAPYGGVIYADYNASAYDKVILDFGGEKVNAPSSVLAPASSTQHTIVAYSVPPFFSTDKILGSITLDVDDTFNPDGLTATGANITITFRPYNVFINGDKAGAFDGPAVEDEDNVATMTNVATSTIGVA